MHPENFRQGIEEALPMKSFNEQKLRELFAFQRFAQHRELDHLIRETEQRYLSSELSDEDLNLVSAAGEPSRKMPDGEGDIHGNT